MPAPNTRVVHHPHTAPLFILAGFPAPINNVVRDALVQERPAAYYISHPFPIAEGERYRASTIDILLKAVAGYITRKRGALATNNIVAPSRVFLLYIPNWDAERLLRAFDYCCFPVAMDATDGRDTRTGRPWYFDPVRAVNVALNTVKRVAKGIKTCLYLETEITQRRGKSPFLLPPRNFRLGKDDYTLAQKFLQYRRGEAAWESLCEELRPRPFNKGQLPRALGPKKKAYFFQDIREIVFPPPVDGEFKGNVYALEEKENGEEKPNEEIRTTLNSLYRFGMPILEQGFHHDAQRVGCLLDRERLECIIRGAIEVSGTHARIYPNDRITAKRIVQLPPAAVRLLPGE